MTDWQRTKVSRDCISLDKSLCKWLGKRFVFLGKHTNCCPADWDHEDWALTLRFYGKALIRYSKQAVVDLDDEEECLEAAKAALRFAADHLEQLWD